MSEADGEGGEGISSLPRRVRNRTVRDVRHYIQATKQKGTDIITSVVILLIEKWLGFWAAVVVSAMFVGGLGVGLVYIAQSAATVPILANNVSWLIGYVGTSGLLIVLTWGVILFSLLLVSAFRVLFWIRRVVGKVWNRHTPPFSAEKLDDEPMEWPPSDSELDSAKEKMCDFFGKGGISFLVILILLFGAESIASDAFYGLLSSSYLTTLGNGLSIAFLVFDFDSLFTSVAPNVTQTQIVLLVLFIVIPGLVMSIGARNFLFLTESGVRERIEEVRNGNLVGWPTAILVSLMLYTVGICFQLLTKWG